MGDFSMNRLRAAVLPFAICFVAIPTFAQSGSSGGQTCSCTAPDGSCSVTITCPGGCVRYCGNKDDCWAECAGSFEDRTTVATVEIKDGTYPQLVKALRSSSGKDLEFIPTKPDARLDVVFKGAPLWNALEFLSDRGKLRIDGRDFEVLRKQRKVLLSGGRTSFSVKNRPVSTFVNDMSFLTGLHLRIVAGRRSAVVNIDLRNVTLRQILNLVSKQTGTKIREV